MKQRILSLLIIALLPFGLLLVSWGTWGHQHVNHAAVFALPDSMRVFFYNHIDFITEESVIPDVRKYSINDKAEFARHYIDLESFQTSASDSVPRTSREAYAKYNSKFLDENGILPWYMIEIMQKLTKAFQDKKKAEILFLAGDLGHYVADATQPLHTSLNHDGQLSNQKGIHSFFESQLPEKFGSTYNFYTGDAVYINDVQKEVWNLINNSHRLADTLLLAEKKLMGTFDTGNVYMKTPEGAIIGNKYNQPVHTYAYASAYHQALNGMVERQLRQAVALTANFWYTAWVNAGRPDLSMLDEPSLTARNSKNYKKDYKEWKKGRLFGFKIDTEF